MSLAPVIAVLRERIGLDSESLGPTVLPRAVKARIQALGLMSPVAYAAYLAGDPRELQTLLGDLAVPETWFFRGGEVFAYLTRLVGEAARLQTRKQYRILSVPCSTGEEPYSLAIALVEAGVPSGAWVIEGIDLSAQYLERARQGRFSDFSFRQTAPELRQRYFRAADGKWELDRAIRSLVGFRQGNLLDPLFLAGEEPFDLIFCRNLFIYLHLDARRRALATLDRLLSRRGLLCAGHAEPLESLDPRFERTGPSGCFLYRRRSDRQGDKETERQVDRAYLPLAETAPLTLTLSPDRGGEGKGEGEAVVPSVTEPVRNAAALSAAPATAAARPVDLLGRAQQQADAGQLDEALATCVAHLTRSGPTADLFSLMGVLHQARQAKDEAMHCFQRALYLEPRHRDALTHLMLLCQEQADHVQAARLRRRLERIDPGGEA